MKIIFIALGWSSLLIATAGNLDPSFIPGSTLSPKMPGLIPTSFGSIADFARAAMLEYDFALVRCAPIPPPPILLSAAAHCPAIVTVIGSGADADALINLFANGITVIGTGVADSSGNFNISSTTELSAGTFSIVVTQTISGCESTQSNAILIMVPTCIAATESELTQAIKTKYCPI